MNGAILLLGSGVLFILAYIFYGRFIERLFGMDPSRPTPAHTQRDDIDFIPTRPSILFGHHFASIAGAGPIVGPILAAQFGWVAVVLWVILGCIFIGAFHDFSVLFLSVRHKGRSIGSIIESLMGYSGRIMFLLFCLLALILVVAQFTYLVVGTFLDVPAVATASLLFIAVAVVFGIFVYRLKVNFVVSSLIFVPITFGCVAVGVYFPIDLSSLLGCSVATARILWTIILLIYCYAASVLPVWILLQPRDYLNSYLLYAMIILGVAGICVAMPEIQLPAFAGWSVPDPRSGVSQPLFPMLFVIIACGACSGFHALVASGTTSKQLANERHVRPVAYGGMLVEGGLAVISLIAVAWMSNADYLKALQSGNEVSLFANGISRFTLTLGVPAQTGMVFISLALAAFLMTTLDTATRLARFVWQELLLPAGNYGEPEDMKKLPTSAVWRTLSNRHCATALPVLTVALLLLGSGTNGLWPVFASANQLLAALSLLGVSMWLMKRGKPVMIALLPMIFMIATSGSALYNMFMNNLNLWQNKGFSAGGVLTLATGVLLIMAFALIVFGVRKLMQKKDKC